MTKSHMSKAITSFTQILRTDSICYLKKSWLVAFIFATAMIFFQACDSPPEDTGLGVLPANELLEIIFTDTADIVLKSTLVDSLITGNAGLQLFGNYIDPEFGSISAAAYTQIIPTGTNLDFGDSTDLRYDSLVFTLDITSAYGRFDSPQKLRIHEVLDPFPDSLKALTSKSDLNIASLNLAGDHVINFQGNDRFSDLRVTLDPSLGKRILYADPVDLASGDSFLDFLKGLYITTEKVSFLSREPGAIFTGLLTSTSTQMSLYFGLRDDSGEFVNQRVNFRVSSFTNRKYSTFERDMNYKDRLLGKILNGQANDQYEVLQSGSLIKAFVKFPGLDKWPRVGINKADLIIKVDNSFSGSVSGISQRYSPPVNLLLILADEDSTESLTSNNFPLINSSAAYDPELEAYVFPVTNYIQEIISQKRENYGLVIAAQDSSTTINRAIIGDTAHPLLKPELRITYTNVK